MSKATDKYSRWGHFNKRGFLTDTFQKFTKLGTHVRYVKCIKALSHGARFDAHPNRIGLNAHRMRIGRVHMSDNTW